MKVNGYSIATFEEWAAYHRAHSMTQAALAEGLGMPTTTVSRNFLFANRRLIDQLPQFFAKFILISLPSLGNAKHNVEIMYITYIGKKK